MENAEIRIERKPIWTMERAAYNPRVELRPGDPEYEALKTSMKDFGVVEPIVWNQRTNRIIGGHQRLTVLQNEGETEADVVVVDLDETQEKQLNVALNKVSGSWADEQLTQLLEGLGPDAEKTGFSSGELDRMLLDAETLVDEAEKEETAAYDTYFNLTLTFDVEDKAEIHEYIKANGKDGLVAAILEKCREAEQNGN